jgi:hypothetical protein
MNNRFAAITREAWIATALAFVLGLIVGWLLLGYLIFPVSFTNVRPSDLDQSFQKDWILMAADSFSVNHDLNLARDRLRWFTPPEITTVLQQQFDVYNKAGQSADAARLRDFAQQYGLNITGAAAATPAATPSPNAGGGGLGSLLIPIVVLALLILVGVGGYYVYSRSRAGAAAPAGRGASIAGAAEEMAPARPMGMPSMPSASGPAPSAARVAPVAAPMERPAPARPAAAPTAKTLGTFAATYKFGDDSYDTAFTLETARGEFLGECGMGISDTIGEGKPDKVTAFDLWLFDKIDVRTLTQILMSEYAFNDQTLRQRLAQKGELVLAEKGKHILLETATLRVDASIVDLVYASTPGLPPNSHFQKLIVQMDASQK